VELRLTPQALSKALLEQRTFKMIQSISVLSLFVRLAEADA